MVCKGKPISLDDKTMRNYLLNYHPNFRPPFPRVWIHNGQEMNLTQEWSKTNKQSKNITYIIQFAFLLYISIIYKSELDYTLFTDF